MGTTSRVCGLCTAGLGRSRSRSQPPDNYQISPENNLKGRQDAHPTRIFWPLWDGHLARLSYLGNRSNQRDRTPLCMRSHLHYSPVKSNAIVNSAWGINRRKAIRCPWASLRLRSRATVMRCKLGNWRIIAHGKSRAMQGAVVNVVHRSILVVSCV
ncbi:hypothetical protein [Microseira wollei]|uniref:hypothetical protein n=1 Tax=Microseira wollei TaxID=467598 RepID=UPI001CFD9B78|nr:hypothetical protein [Microseira wollei]